MEAQAMCFMAGASSIFAGDKLLTTPNPEFNEDLEMFRILGLEPKESFTDGAQPESKPDQKIEERKMKEAQREQELAEARAKVRNGEFEPRKVTTV